MTVNEVRKRYLDFYAKRGHAIIPSAPIVPENDPTTLFTSSGMQPLVPYLLGQPHPEGTRLTNSQLSFRAGDIEEVGDNRHTTFFEMLGNWSLGDYFKKDQLKWFFEFLTNKDDVPEGNKGLSLDPQKLFVTVFSGHTRANIPADEDSANIWKQLFSGKGIDAKTVNLGTEENASQVGMQEGRIFYYNAKKNWWSRAGIPEKMPSGEPGGPDSEVFYDFGTDHNQDYGKYCHPNCDCGRFMEIGNSVFMEYIKNADGTFGKLPKQNVDFGGGLERLTAATNDNSDVFCTDALYGIIQQIEIWTGKRYDDPTLQKFFRVIADHIRAAVFMIQAGVSPASTDRGYVLRRLLRRSVLHADKVGLKSSDLYKIVPTIADIYHDAYPAILEGQSDIAEVILQEEKRFRATLDRGLKEFNWRLRTLEGGQAVAEELPASIAFDLVTTYGFPFELVQEEAQARGMTVDKDQFENRIKAHQVQSRAGAAQKFAGGLADHAEQTVKYHTAHHLLLKALQKVLGPEVHQRGSNITSERLRIDFSYGQKMTPEQIQEVERIVNEQIQKALPVVRVTMTREEAEALGAEHEFGAKYPDMVSVYFIGERDNPFSIEFCGGPHVANTRELSSVREPDGSDRKAVFKILKEEASSAGVRRIKAVLQ